MAVKRSNSRLAGRIKSVNKEDQFVLIRRYGAWRVDEGELVESRGDGRTANLMATGEKLGEHIAADVRSGHVEVGDGVYIRRIFAPSNPSVDVVTRPLSPVAVPQSVPIAVPRPALPIPPSTPAVPEDRL